MNTLLFGKSQSMFSYLIQLSLFFSCSSVLAQTTRFVRISGIESNPISATSWASATNNLQGAIDASQVGDQVWVASGIFKPTSLTGPNSRTISFSMRDGVAVYGGFAGYETAVGQRLTATLERPSSTTLSGDIGSPDSTDNSRHVINNRPGLTNTALLDGFVITRGYADGDYYADTNGGAMYNDGSGQNQVCSPTIQNCLFIANSATVDGGAVYNNGVSKGNCSPRFSNCHFVKNRVGNSGGAINSHSIGGLTRIELVNCSIINNVAFNGGGGIVNDGFFSGNNSALFVNCSFIGNTAQISEGGAVVNTGNNGLNLVEFTNCSFSNNKAARNGWAISSSGYSGISNTQLTNCVLYDNGGNKAFNAEEATIKISYSLYDSTTTVGYSSGPGNFTTGNPFYSPTDLRLLPCSSAIDGGDPTSQTVQSGPYSLTALPMVDLAGKSRVINGRADMGAYEFQPDDMRLITVKDGLWSDPAVWSCKRVPTNTDPVYVRHLISLPNDYTANAGTVQLTKDSRITHKQGARLKVHAN